MNTNWLATLSRREKFLGITAVLSITLILFIFYWYLPSKSYLEARGRLLREKEQELRGVQDLAQNLTALKRRLQQAHQYANRLEEQFPGQLDPAQLVRQLSTAARDTGISLIEITAATPPEQQDNERAFSAFAFRFGCAGTYSRLTAFIKKITAIAPVVQIDKLEIEKQPDGLLQCQLGLKTFADKEASPSAQKEVQGEKGTASLPAPERASPF
ncbi:MAG: type 4a pilus biogenesis protein PilO [Bacillota bacterium]|nr:type 4a pilus biogenesis protein PilO [Bacillota bacterium]